jgi:hypothetical protein
MKHLMHKAVQSIVNEPLIGFAELIILAVLIALAFAPIP